MLQVKKLEVKGTKLRGGRGRKKITKSLKKKYRFDFYKRFISWWKP